MDGAQVGFLQHRAPALQKKHGLPIYPKMGLCHENYRCALGMENWIRIAAQAAPIQQEQWARCRGSWLVPAKGDVMWKQFLMFLLLLAAPQLNAQDTARVTAEQARILTMESAWNQAVQQKDAAGLKLLLAADLVYVDYDGTLMNKTEYLASVQSQGLHPERVVSEFMNVHLYGAVAVVNGVYREKGVKNERPYALRERFTDTWVRQGERWICVASHSTLIRH
jgi:ketosteroid isomerase-like protein